MHLHTATLSTHADSAHIPLHSASPRPHLDLNPKPECHYTIFVDLTPDVEGREYEGRAEHGSTQEDSNDVDTDGIEYEHEHIVCWSTTEIA